MSDSQPLISVITPTYNRADFVVEAVESVLAQTYPHFELLIVDDGSTDNTREVLEPYLKDGRIRLFYQENQGQSVARNRGLDEATGDFVCFLDSDNAWLPDKFEKSLKAFDDNPGSDVVYGDFIVIDEQGREIGTNRMKRHSGRITPHLLHDNFVSMNTTMTRRQCFVDMGGFDKNDRLAEDYGLWLRLSTRYKFYYLPALLGYYRVMENQISSDKDSRFEANEAIVHHFIEAFPDALTISERKRGLSRFYVRKARYELSVRRLWSAWRGFVTAVKYDPFWLGPWRFLAKLAVSIPGGGRG